jgi:hypothetical protein
MDNDDTEETFAVYCYYRDNAKVKELIESGLSLDEAKSLVKDPESSSRTCSDKTAAQRSGEWFFGWTEE